MTQQEQIARNPRLLFWARAFIEIKAMTAIIVLFYLHRGVELHEVFWLSIVWSLTALLTEIPSGYLADRIGRKKTMLLGAALLALMYVGEWFAHGFWQFAMVFVLMSSAFSCFSGTEEAMLYESLLALGREKEMTHKNGQLFSARSVFKTFVPFMGAMFASSLLEWQFKTLIVVNALALLVAVICIVRLREPQHRKDILEGEIGIFRESIETMMQEPWLIRVALNKVLVFIAVFLAWRVYQPLLNGQGMGVEWLGVFDMLTHMLIFVGAWFLGKCDKQWGTKRIIVVTALITMATLVFAGYTTTPWMSFVLLLITIGVGSAREPIFAHMVNERVCSRSRATTLSNLNVIKSIFDIPVLLLAGWLASQSITFPLYLGAVLCLIAIMIFPYERTT